MNIIQYSFMAKISHIPKYPRWYKRYPRSPDIWGHRLLARVETTFCESNVCLGLLLIRLHICLIPAKQRLAKCVHCTFILWKRHLRFKKTRSSAKQAGSSLPMPEDPYRTCWGPGRRSCRAGHAICWNIQQVGNLLALQTLAYRIASLPLYFSSSALKGQDQHECKLVLKLLKTSSIINLTTCD